MVQKRVPIMIMCVGIMRVQAGARRGLIEFVLFSRRIDLPVVLHMFQALHSIEKIFSPGPKIWLDALGMWRM